MVANMIQNLPLRTFHQEISDMKEAEIKLRDQGMCSVHKEQCELVTTLLPCCSPSSWP